MTNREWQPIETAPKDGTCFLAWSLEADWLVVRWGKLSHVPSLGWIVADGDPEDQGGRDDLTHWMPLPEPPSEVQP